MLINILKDIGISDTASRIYMRLAEYGSSSARQLAENLNIPRPSVYDNIKLLIKEGLVVERAQDNKKLFQVDDTKNISRLLRTKIDHLKQEEKELTLLLPTLAAQTYNIEPKIKFYSGVEGVKQVLNDLLWYDHIETQTMWPISEMMKILGPDYLEKINRKRLKNSIYIRGVWPHNKIVDIKKYPFMGVGRGFLRELRTSPKEMTWNMGYWLYADKVAFISSRRESFGFLIHSQDFANLMKAQFEQIWKICVPIKPQPKYTDKYLETIKIEKLPNMRVGI